MAIVIHTRNFIMPMFTLSYPVSETTTHGRLLLSSFPLQIMLN